MYQTRDCQLIVQLAKVGNSLRSEPYFRETKELLKYHSYYHTYFYFIEDIY